MFRGGMTRVDGDAREYQKCDISLGLEEAPPSTRQLCLQRFALVLHGNEVGHDLFGGVLGRPWETYRLELRPTTA